jgi:hypothetical protein
MTELASRPKTSKSKAAIALGAPFALLALLLVAATLFAGGCSKQVIIGDESEDALRASVTNGTGRLITEAKMKLASDEDFDIELLGLGEQWEDGQTVSLSYKIPEEAAQAPKTPEGAAGGSDEPPLFDIQVLLASSASATLHGVDLSTLKSAIILYDVASGLAYLEFTDPDGDKVSTLEGEKAFRAEAEAAEAARIAAEKKAAAEAEAKKKAEAEEKAAEKKAKEQAAKDANGSQSYDYGSGSGGSGGVNQSQDSCVDDVILR